MRLIDADLLKADYFVPSTSSGTTNYMYVSLFQIVNAPTVDAIPVVRCNDCKHNDGSCCDYSAVYTRPNGYCCWGERKDGEHEDND